MFSFLLIWQLLLLIIIVNFVAILVSERYTRWMITFNNKAQGVQTNITKQTIIAYRIVAILGIIMGIFMFLFFSNSYR